MLTVKLLSLIEPDKKIQAIKNLRAATGLGLAESKRVVDEMHGYAGSVRISGGAQPQEVKVPEGNLDLIEERFTFEVLGGIVPDPARLALRAAVIDVTPATLESLGAVLPVGSESRLLFDEAVSLLRSVGAS